MIEKASNGEQLVINNQVMTAISVKLLIFMNIKQLKLNKYQREVSELRRDLLFGCYCPTLPNYVVSGGVEAGEVSRDEIVEKNKYLPRHTIHPSITH